MATKQLNLEDTSTDDLTSMVKELEAALAAASASTTDTKTEIDQLKPVEAHLQKQVAGLEKLYVDTRMVESSLSNAPHSVLLDNGSSIHEFRRLSENIFRYSPDVQQGIISRINEYLTELTDCLNTINSILH